MRLRTAIPLVAVLGLLASGCSGGGAKPTTLPSLSATPPVTASPATVPIAARAQTPVGAVAFVHFFYDQVNAAFSTADPGLLFGLSDPACGTCKNYAQAAQQFRTDGQRIRGTSVRILTAEAPPLDRGFIAVDVFFDAPARAVVDMTGRVVKGLPAEPRYHRTVYVERVSAGWILRAVKDAMP